MSETPDPACAKLALWIPPPCGGSPAQGRPLRLPAPTSFSICSLTVSLLHVSHMYCKGAACTTGHTHENISEKQPAQSTDVHVEQRRTLRRGHRTTPMRTFRSVARSLVRRHHRYHRRILVPARALIPGVRAARCCSCAARALRTCASRAAAASNRQPSPRPPTRDSRPRTTLAPPSHPG